MNVPPVSVERVQKCVVNFEIYRFLKKAANLPHPPLRYIRLPQWYLHTVNFAFWNAHKVHSKCRKSSSKSLRREDEDVSGGDPDLADAVDGFWPLNGQVRCGVAGRGRSESSDGARYENLQLILLRKLHHVVKTWKERMVSHSELSGHPYGWLWFVTVNSHLAGWSIPTPGIREPTGDRFGH